jgi:large subunit ribosomal protein L25
MKELQLAAQARQAGNKGQVRRLRAAGSIPGVLYGLDKEPQPLGVSGRDFHKVLREAGENALLDLALTGSKTEKVLVRELQRHPVSEEVLHVDFLRIDITKEIELTVPIRLVGTAAGVKAGGVLEFVRRDLKISCLPTKIPSAIDVDISELDINEAIHVSDLSVEEVEILTDPQRTIVVVHPPIIAKLPEAEAEAAEEEEVAAAEEAAAEPEVITEKKKEEEESEEKK